VTKLQVVRIKAKLVYISRRRTTSGNENDTYASEQKLQM